ncbi:MAG: DUF58 domain-containing protein [Spirochaetales bacterium]
MAKARAQLRSRAQRHADRAPRPAGSSEPAGAIETDSAGQPSNPSRGARELLKRYYPFTGTGSVIAAAGVTFTALGEARGDVYQATLGVVAIAATVILAMLSRIQAGRFSDVPVKWDDPPEAASRTFGNARTPTITVQATGIAPWFFFRLHSRIKGTLKAGKSRRFHVFEEVATPTAEQISIPLALPLPGTVALHRTVEVRDVFGLTRGAFTATTTREITVCAPMPLAPQLTRMVAASGEQENTRTTSPEEERYYMREYIPGDRFRDINWKASSRIRELVTRISPQTQEKDRTITIYLRHFRESDRESMEALGHLAYLKGWVVAFMRAIRREDHGAQFRVVTADGMHSIRTDEEISRFSGAICRLNYQPAPANLEQDPAARMVIIFTTPFDTSLAAFTDSMHPIRCELLSTQFAEKRGNAGMHSSDRLNLTTSASALPMPPVRVLEPDNARTVSAPPAVTFLEDVSLTPVTEPADLTASEKRRAS